MKIAFTTQGTDWQAQMDARFGRTKFLLVYDEEQDSFTHFDNQAIANEAHGAGPLTAQKLFDLKADVLITGNGPGGNAATVLKKAGLKVFAGAGEHTVEKAYQAYKNSELNEFPL